MARFEMYNTQTECVDDILDITQKEADERNIAEMKTGGPYRFILERETPPATCRCAAEYAYECVCNF